MSNRPREVIIAAVFIILYGIWQLLNSWNSIQLLLGAVALFSGIGLLLRLKVAYYISMILASILAISSFLLSAATYISTYLSYGYGRLPDVFETMIINFVLSVFVLYCLRTYAARSYYQNNKSQEVGDIEGP